MSVGKLGLGGEPNEICCKLDVLRLSLVHLNGSYILNGSLDVEAFDDFGELAGLELGVP